MISVVTPIYNEQENLPELRRRLVAALAEVGRAWEVIFVDDGSTDGSAAMLRRMHEEDPRLKVISLSRNFGHQPAITAGVHHAQGECVILIDGDLQDPPEVIPAMVEKWEQGCQVVLGERRSRAEAGARGWGFRLFYPVMRWMADLPEGPDAGIFGLMDRVVVDEFNRLPERKRFIPGLRRWLGFNVGAVAYDRKQRHAGRPKQSLRRLLRYAGDAMLSFSYKPLRAAAWLGFAASGFAFLMAIYYFITFFAFHKQSGSGFTTLVICVLFLGGVQLVCLGILGEYVGRIYEEVKQRPLYVVAEKIGFDQEARARPAGEGMGRR